MNLWPFKKSDNSEKQPSIASQAVPALARLFGNASLEPGSLQDHPEAPHLEQMPEVGEMMELTPSAAPMSFQLDEESGQPLWNDTTWPETSLNVDETASTLAELYPQPQHNTAEATPQRHFESLSPPMEGMQPMASPSRFEESDFSDPVDAFFPDEILNYSPAFDEAGPQEATLAFDHTPEALPAADTTFHSEAFLPPPSLEMPSAHEVALPPLAEAGMNLTQPSTDEALLSAWQEPALMDPPTASGQPMLDTWGDIPDSTPTWNLDAPSHDMVAPMDWGSSDDAMPSVSMAFPSEPQDYYQPVPEASAQDTWTPAIFMENTELTETPSLMSWAPDGESTAMDLTPTWPQEPVETLSETSMTEVPVWKAPDALSESVAEAPHMTFNATTPTQETFTPEAMPKHDSVLDAIRADYSDMPHTSDMAQWVAYDATPEMSEPETIWAQESRTEKSQSDEPWMAASQTMYHELASSGDDEQTMILELLNAAVGEPMPEPVASTPESMRSIDIAPVDTPSLHLETEWEPLDPMPAPAFSLSEPVPEPSLVNEPSADPMMAELAILYPDSPMPELLTPAPVEAPTLPPSKSLQPGPRPTINYLPITESLTDFEAQTLLQETHFMKRSIDRLVDAYFSQQEPETLPELP